MTDLSYDVVDVFTDPDVPSPYSGNQLAVVHGAAHLPTESLQAIAQEFGFSETTFPTVRDDGSGTSYDVRIFTPGAEIPFAGHPTLGTAWVLRDLGLLTGEAAVQHCGAGEVGVSFHDDQGLVELSAAAGDCLALPEAAAHALLEDVGLGPGDVTGEAFVAGTGLDFCYLPVTDDAVRRARPGRADVLEVIASVPGGPEVLTRLTTVLDAVSVYALDGETDPLGVHSRVFVPGLSVPEDPATGSCAAGLGLVLRASGRLAESGRYEIRQGVEVARPSRLHGRCDPHAASPDRVRVAGRVTRTMQGTLLLPE